jgi:hypothetical protein
MSNPFAKCDSVGAGKDVVWDVDAVPSRGLTPVYRLGIGCTERDVLGTTCDYAQGTAVAGARATEHTLGLAPCVGAQLPCARGLIVSQGGDWPDSSSGTGCPDT